MPRPGCQEGPLLSSPLVSFFSCALFWRHLLLPRMLLTSVVLSTSGPDGRWDLCCPQCRRLVLALPFQERRHVAEWSQDVPSQHLEATQSPVQPRTKHNDYCSSCSLEDVPTEQVSVISRENLGAQVQ